jgi:hypothetical protein
MPLNGRNIYMRELVLESSNSKMIEVGIGIVLVTIMNWLF